MEPETAYMPPPLILEGVTPPKRRGLFGGLNTLLRAFSPAERLLLYVLTLVLGVSAFVLLADVNRTISTEVPTQGGSLTEGAAGTPRFVNPLLAVSQPDQDLTILIYSGLLRAGEKDNYVPDLAESLEVSEDGTVYTFHLRPNLTFHDGTPLTSADVLFTVSLAQNAEIKSPRRADWEGVALFAPDERTVVFTLPHAYAPFRENATLGILPKALWENVAAEEFPFSSLNTHPIGSGPYRVQDITFDTTGAPTTYALAAFTHFALGTPNVTKLIYRLFANTEALIAAFENGDVESFVADSPKSLARDIQESADARRVTLARVFGIFLNQNHAPVLTGAAVRRALEAAIDKDEIIEKVLGGYGVVLGGPIPPGLLLGEGAREASMTRAHADRIADARALLTKGGWKFQPAAMSTAQAGSSASSSNGVWTKDKQTLSLTLATADTEELVATAHAVANAWNAVGIKTSVEVYPLQEFNSSILRPRLYDAVVFGEVVSRSLDLFAFWHSSQRNDPGLNLSLYTSAAADKLLASARAENDDVRRSEFVRSFVKTVQEDRPAVFLYAPQIVYIAPARLQGVTFGTITSPSERFASIHTWYRDTERVWNIFAK